MVGRRVGWRRAAQTLAALLLALGLAACGGNEEEPSGSQQEGGKIRLTIGTFGNFGYKELYKKYMELHPNIEIVEQVAEYNQHHERLTTRLAAGSGTYDIEAIDEGFIVQMKHQADKFNNLIEFGADKIKDRWLPWKWEQSLSPDGRQIGLGTDVGGLAICYRHDLFEKAGLPTDREEVSKLWPTWEDFIETGQRFQARSGGVKWIDSGTNLYNAILAQGPESYYKSGTDELIAGSNPHVKKAWDLTMQALQADLSAGLAAFSPEWNTGFQQGSFATVTCPAWMMGYIQEQAPGTKGKWDVASVPEGGGNWGGSFLSVPKASKHPKEAYELAAWLTAPEQELQIFKETGNLPSLPELYDDPAVVNFKNEFFNNAPVGKIFTEAARELVPQYQGPDHGAIRQAFENAINRVQQGSQQPQEAWEQALKDAEQAAS